MTKKNPEFDVYSRCKQFFDKLSWKILCASPPGGTDTRFKKCRFPREDQDVTTGPRDEVDMVAFKNQFLCLVECKPKLSDSLNKVNNLGESDLVKLHRLIGNHSHEDFQALFEQGFGISISEIRQILPILVIESIDCDLPNNAIVIELSGKIPRIQLGKYASPDHNNLFSIYSSDYDSGSGLKAAEP